MSHTAFGEFFPEIANKETRIVTIIDQAITGLPPGTYALIDLYCTNRILCPMKQSVSREA